MSDQPIPGDSTEDLRLLLLRYDTRQTNIHIKILDELLRRASEAMQKRCELECERLARTFEHYGDFGAEHGAYRCLDLIRELK